MEFAFIIGVIGLITLFIVVNKKYRGHITNVETLHNENKTIGFDGQIREWPIGSYYRNNDPLKFNKLFASRHSIKDIMGLVQLGYSVLLENGDDEETRYLKRFGKTIDEPLGELIGLYVKDGKLLHLYEGKLNEIKEKGYDYVIGQ